MVVFFCTYACVNSKTAGILYVDIIIVNDQCLVTKKSKCSVNPLIGLKKR